MNTQELLATAKRDVDLVAFLVARGWMVNEGNNARWRQVDGPGGERLLVHRSQAGEWLWQDTKDRTKGGDLYQLLARLDGGTHEQIVAAIQTVLHAPPRSLEVRQSGHVEPTSTRHQRWSPRALPSLDEASTAYLTGSGALDPATVTAFAHSLRSLPGGVVVGLHNDQGDGEQKGPGTPEQFYGSQDDDPGRGRSLYVARPDLDRVPEVLLLTDGFLDALSAWECMEARLQPITGVASTGGSVTVAGKDKLRRTLAGMMRERDQQPALTLPKLILIDAGNVGSQAAEQRATWLQEAAIVGMKYLRIVPPAGKDWNEYLALQKRPTET